MALFARKSRFRGATTPADRVSAFWQWWSGAQVEIAAGLDAGDAQQVRRLLAPRVAQLHKDLEWEFSPGRTARWCLVISSGGRPELRALAERWRRGGPADDAAWEYRPARQADPDAFRYGLVVTVEGVEVNVASMVMMAHADDRRCRLDVSVYHPRMADMTEPGRAQLAFQALDLALGEDAVERWLGVVQPLTEEPARGTPLSSLGRVVDGIEARWARHHWAMLEGMHANRRLVATVRHPVSRVDHPLFDEHVAVRLPYRIVREDGLPDESATNDMQMFEEQLISRLGGSALLVGRETTCGERILHLYGDATRPIAPLIEAMLGAYPGGQAGVETRHDPAWRALERLRP